MQRILILFLLLASPFANAQKKQEKRVRAAFENYKSAILNENGEEAVHYLDSRTIAYYKNILSLVKTADSTQAETLSFQDKFMVLTIRHRATREEILEFDGTSLIVYCIDKGMIGKSSVSSNSIGEVTINGDFASGAFLSNGQSTPFAFDFYREEKQWKIDLTSLFLVADLAFKQVIAKSGMPENEFLFSILESLSGTKPGPEVWLPVK